mgnify:CR=1 FL=1|jgi:hypothetical protein
MIVYLSADDAKMVSRSLAKYRTAVSNIESLAEEKARLETVITSLSVGDGGGGSGVGHDKIGSVVSRLVDLIDRIDADVADYVKTRDEVRRIIRRVSDVNPIYGQDLHYRYIDGRSAFATANDLGFSSRQERRVHAAALSVAFKYL